MDAVKPAPAVARADISWVRVLLAVLVGLWIVEVYVYIGNAVADPYFEPGMDYRFYVDAAARWLETGVYYLPRQLTGETYQMLPMVDVMYPPTALVLFVPFVFLPAVLWWAIPIGLIAYAVRRWQPGPWALVAIVILLGWPGSLSVLVYGNTNLWIAAGVAGGLLWGWPAALVLLKPTLAPLALVGVKHRSWWVAMVALGVSTLLTLPAWRDYAISAVNIRGLEPVTYILWGLPILFVPLVAWYWRR